MPVKTILILIVVIFGSLFVVPHEYIKKISSRFVALYTSEKNVSLLSDDEKALTSYCTDQKKSQEQSQQAYVNKYTSYIIASVIYYPKTAWARNCWINVGSSTKDIPFKIEKNCPVVSGDTLVGIVDYVGETTSQIRLLSDPSVRPAVRVVREYPNTSSIISAIDTIQQALIDHPDLLSKQELTQTLQKLLDYLYASLPSPTYHLLAKGELQGRKTGQNASIFHGVGFQYAYDDEEGKKRDLITGKTDPESSQIALILPGDILETSGKDATFPKGLKVAQVISVDSLEEGAVSYTITAKSTAPIFPEFDTLAILPPVTTTLLKTPTIAEKILPLIEETPP